MEKAVKYFLLSIGILMVAVGCGRRVQNQNAVVTPSTNQQEADVISDEDRQQLLQQLQDIQNEADEITDVSQSTSALDPNIRLETE